MPTENKIKIVEQLSETIARASIVLATDYRGLSVKELTELRNQLRQSNMEYHVVKNTLARLAAEKAGRPELAAILGGPTALAFGYSDATQSAKALEDYCHSEKAPLGIKGGLLGQRLLSTSDVLTLSTLPPMKEQAVKLVGAIYSPIFALLNVLSANMRRFAGILQARIQQLEGVGNVN